MYINKPDHTNMYGWSLVIFSLGVQSVYSFNFQVNGGFSAGPKENGERPFSIGDTNLDAVDVFDDNDLTKQFNPKDASIDSDGKVTFSAGRQTDQTKRINARTNEQGFKYKHMKPKDNSASGSSLYLPHIDNLYVHETDVNTNTVRAIRLDGWIRKTIITEIKQEIKQNQNAIRVLGAFFGLNMRLLKDVLTFDRETVAFVESVKAGSIPVYIPGDMFVGETLQVNTNDAQEVPSYCDAWSGASASGTDARGTTDWILRNVMGFDAANPNAERELKIVQVDANEEDLSTNEKFKRWDNRRAFNNDKDLDGTRGGNIDPYKISDSDYEDKFKVVTEINGKNYDFEKIFKNVDLDQDTELTPEEREDFEKARYDPSIIEEFQDQIDSCSRPT